MRLLTAVVPVVLIISLPSGLASQRPGVTNVTDPCVIERASGLCAMQRLDQLEQRLAGIEATLRDLQTPQTTGKKSRPPIAPVGDDEKADAEGFAYLQRRIDSIQRTLNEVVQQWNAR